MNDSPASEPSLPEAGARTARRAFLAALAIAVLHCLVAYLAFGGRDLRLGDEGYLWYGVQRTAAGAVPLRDFQSYEPGRYYWCSLFKPLFGDGLLGLRAATALFKALGLTFALLVASRFVRGLAELVLCGVLLGLWMFPPHKSFESSLAAMATWFVVRMLENPSTRRIFATGAFVGLSGFFGRNHALYGAVASALALGLVLGKRRELAWKPRVGAWVGGGLVGSLPLLGMLLFVPGFAASLWESTLVILQNGANLPYPWTWPWTPDWAGLDGWGRAGAAAEVLCYLMPWVALPLGLLAALRCPGGRLAARAVIVGAACTGLAYIHHAAVRSHPHHLAECLPPTLLLVFAWVGARSGWPRRASWTLLCAVTALMMLQEHPLLSRYRPGSKPPELVDFDVNGESIAVSVFFAPGLENLRSFVNANIPRDQPLFIAPNRPGLYPLLGRVAPTWWIYFFWPASEAEQQTLIADLERNHVNWALLIEREIDGRQDMSFRSTHPLVTAYLQRNFRLVSTPGFPPDHLMLRRVR